MPRHFSSETERALFAIANLTDRKKLATLKDDRAANRRLRQCLYWMQAARAEGTVLDSLLEQALASYADAPGHHALVHRALLRNYRRAQWLGCLSAANLSLLRRGASPVIEYDRYRGEKLEVDHIVPIKHAHALRNDFANLSLIARTPNRQKAARVSASQIEHAKRLVGAGLLPAASLPAWQAAAPRLFPPASPAPAAAAGSFGVRGGATDPRVLIPRVQTLTEQMEDWERRSGAAFETGEYVQHHAAEHVGRAGVQAAATLSRAREDRLAVESLRREFARCRERCADAARRVRQAQEESTQMQTATAQAAAHWRGELDAARRWLVQAQAAEARAEEIRDQTRAALYRAGQALDTARSALADARGRVECVGRDREGRALYRPVDTAPYENAVREAEYAVAHWRARLEAAEQDLERARQERRAAEARVGACTRAVHLAEQGQAEASQALAATMRAESAAERALEEQARAGNFAEQAEEKSREEMQAAEAAETKVGAARTHESAAQAAFALAGQAQADARQRSCQARLEIAWRLDQLRAFDAPMSLF